MCLGIPPLDVKIMLESNPLKSRIVRRLAARALLMSKGPNRNTPRERFPLAGGLRLVWGVRTWKEGPWSSGVLEGHVEVEISRDSGIREPRFEMWSFGCMRTDHAFSFSTKILRLLAQIHGQDLLIQA